MSEMTRKIKNAIAARLLEKYPQPPLKMTDIMSPDQKILIDEFAKDEGVYGPRFRIGFAWKPVVTDDGEVIWLEKYASRYFLRGAFYDPDWEYRAATDPWVTKVGVSTKGDGSK